MSTDVHGRNQASLMEEAAVHSLGKDLVSRMAMLLKTVRIHSINNSALQYSVKIFMSAANSLYSHLGDFTLRGDIDSVFIDDIRIRAEPILWDNIVQLLKELGKRQVGGLVFQGPMTPPQVRSLLGVILDHPDLLPSEGANVLNEALNAKGLGHVRFIPRLALVTDTPQIITEEEAKAKLSVRVYAELLATTHAYHAVVGQSVPQIVRGRLLQAVQAAVDLLHDAPEWVMSAATFRDNTEYGAVHSVNICLLSLALGHRIELGRKALLNLGLAALYADSGMRRMGLDAEGKPPPGATESVNRHPLHSVKEVLQTPALTRAQRDRILVAFEHHTGVDGTGWPKRIAGKPKHLFAMIVSLADRYDELTSDRQDGYAMSTSEALETLTKEAPFHDSRLLSIFFHLLGPFPIGSVVELSTGEIGAVFRQSTDARFRHRPVVKLAQNVKGVSVDPVIFDLTACDSHGSFLAHVHRVLTPGALGESGTVSQILYASAEAEAEEAPRPKWNQH